TASHPAYAAYASAYVAARTAEQTALEARRAAYAAAWDAGPKERRDDNDRTGNEPRYPDQHPCRRPLGPAGRGSANAHHPCPAAARGRRGQAHQWRVGQAGGGLGSEVEVSRQVAGTRPAALITNISRGRRLEMIMATIPHE